MAKVKPKDPLRPPIRNFARMMERKMRMHDHSRGDSWKKLTLLEISDFIENEEAELQEAFARWEKLREEGPHVGPSAAKFAWQTEHLLQEIGDVANGLMFFGAAIRRDALLTLKKRAQT